MGLTVHYRWKKKCDAGSARHLVASFHELAKKLPFDRVSDIYEQSPPDAEFSFYPLENEPPQGTLYLSRKRNDGQSDFVEVPAQHAVFFSVYVEGAESARIGLASHPPVVIHYEDVIERDDNGIETRYIGRGAPIEYPTRLRGFYSWQASCKTQYAGNPKLGGETNFLRAHLSLIELLDQIGEAGIQVRMIDDSRYAKHRNVDRLLGSLRDWDAMIARVVGKLSDQFGNDLDEIIAPIKERQDFEHIEAKGIEVLRRLAIQQRKRNGKRNKPE